MEEQLMPDEFDEQEVEAITEFLSDAGGLMLLAELYDGPKRFVTLTDRIEVSTSTVSDRMDEARELGLLQSEENPMYNENGNKVHPLTSKGEVIASELRITDLARIQQEIWALENEFEEQLDEFEGTLNDKRSELNEQLKNRVAGSL